MTTTCRTPAGERVYTTLTRTVDDAGEPEDKGEDASTPLALPPGDPPHGDEPASVLED